MGRKKKNFRDKGKENLLKVLDDKFVLLGDNLIKIDTIKRIGKSTVEGGTKVVTEDDTIRIEALKWPKFMTNLQELRELIEKEIIEALKVPAEVLQPTLPTPPPLEEAYEHQIETKPVELEAKQKTGRVIPLENPIMNRTSTVYIDNPQLSSGSGDLPLSPGETIVGRAGLLVIGKDGRCLGTCSSDGMITGEGVTGHISCMGKYRLVFKEYAFMDATVTYKVKQGNPPPRVNVV